MNLGLGFGQRNTRTIRATFPQLGQTTAITLSSDWCGDHFYSSDEEEKTTYSSEEQFSSDEEVEKKRIRFEDRTVRLTARRHRTGVLQTIATDEQNILNIPKDCCSSNCLRDISISVIQNCRTAFYHKTQTEQSNFIAQNLLQRDAHKETQQKPKFLLCGRTICDTAWRVVHDIKYRRYQYIRRKLQITGSWKMLNLTDGRKGMQYQTAAYSHVKDFLSDYSKNFGDDQPDTPETHLPSCVTKKSVYEDYQLNCLNKGLVSITLTRFYQIWEAEFGHVKVRKHQKMTQCSECAIFKEAFLKKLTAEEAKELEIRRKAHLTLQRICREDYYRHRSKAAEEPQKYVSLIIDNMDQSKTNLPRFPFVSKNDSGLSKLHHHVTGVLCHNQRKSYAFTWTDQFPSNCNVTLNCLMSVLDEVAKENDGSLPPNIYIQADNAAKDNKNNYVLIFLAMLVKAKLARKIKFSFLMVGHTHEDVDQFFSRISTRANQQAAVTLEDFNDLIEKSVNPSPVVKNLASLWDFRSIADVPDGKLENFKECHVFKFTLCDERVLLSYKNWPLKSEKYRSEDITDIVPNLVLPPVCSFNTTKFEPILHKMETDLPKWALTGRFNQNNLEWWTQYLQHLRTRPTVPGIPLPQQFKEYRVPAPKPPTLDDAVARMINRHIEKLHQQSVIKVKRKRQPRQ